MVTVVQSVFAFPLLASDPSSVSPAADGPCAAYLVTGCTCDQNGWHFVVAAVDNLM